MKIVVRMRIFLQCAHHQRAFSPACQCNGSILSVVRCAVERGDGRTRSWVIIMLCLCILIEIGVMMIVSPSIQAKRAFHKEHNRCTFIVSVVVLNSNRINESSFKAMLVEEKESLWGKMIPTLQVGGWAPTITAKRLLIRGDKGSCDLRRNSKNTADAMKMRLHTWENHFLGRLRGQQHYE